MSNDEIMNQWLARAKSNLAKARAGRVTDDILFEDLCFDIQQSVEKALKALCVKRGIVFPKTHSIDHLMDLLSERNVIIPENIGKARLLTEYAVQTRSPGDYEPIREPDYREAMDIAESVMNWVAALIAAEK